MPTFALRLSGFWTSSVWCDLALMQTSSVDNVLILNVLQLQNELLLFFSLFLILNVPGAMAVSYLARLTIAAYLPYPR